MSTPEIYATIFFFGLCLVSYLIYGKSDPSELHDTNGGEVMRLTDLAFKNSLVPGTYHATLIRQSGNIHRDLGHFPSPAAAIFEASKSFKRAGVENIRVTYSDEGKLAAYRSIYNFRGRAEGKKFAGAIFQLITPDITSPISYLDFKVREAVNTSGTKWKIFFDYRCKKCDGTKIEVPDDRTDSSPVYCKGCGHVFGSFSELTEFSKRNSENYLATLETRKISSSQTAER
jgi:hypothetical protein